MRIKEDCGHGSKDGKAHSKWSEKGAVPPKRLRGLGSSNGRGRCDVSNCGIINYGLWQQLGERAWDRISGQGGTSFGKQICFFISGETSVTGDPLEAQGGVVGEGGGEGSNIPEGLRQEIRGG